MADVSDVENALVAALAQIVYPNGTGHSSIVGSGCRIYRGWPIPKNLDLDLAAGILNISVFPQDNEQKTTRYPKKWLELPTSEPTLTVQAYANTITLGGTPSSPLNVAAIVDGTAYVYPVQLSDTLTSIATGLAALINVDIPATSAGPVVTILVNAMHLVESGPLSRRFGGALIGSMAAYWSTASLSIIARIGTVGSVIREIKRQKRGFQITFWCPTRELQDAITAPCDVALADIDYLSLSDGTLARLLYVRTFVIDKVQREGLYRRDLIYSVEYGTTETMNAPQVVTQKFCLSGGLDPSEPAIKTFFN